jgi:DNA repair photolyase
MKLVNTTVELPDLPSSPNNPPYAYISDKNVSQIIIHEKVGQALTRQKKIDQHNFPFTLNATMGCLFGCRYCYLQGFPFNRHTNFGEQVKVKVWLPNKLDSELNKKKYRDLPQYLKRVQVNSATQGYLPQVINKMQKEYDLDLMGEILQVFKKHKESGNFWLVHLLTKSNAILSHLDLLSSMRDQIQIEMTITTLDEARRKLLEGKAPSVAKRLEAIRKLSDAGIFVRVMAMPFIGDCDAAMNLRDETFKYGARAFKHKSLNYFDEEALLDGRLVRIRGRRDSAYENLILKSGEPYQAKGEPKKVSMPNEKWNEWEIRPMMIENHGYADINQIDWTYLR